MKNLYLTLGLLLSFFLCTSLSGQVTLIALDNEALPGDTVEIDITVANFEFIGSIQFALFWDNDVIQYRDLRNFGLAQLNNSMTNNGNFGFAELDQGKLRFSWLDMDQGFVNLDDDTVIFTVVFDVVGSLGDSSPLEIGSCDNVPTLVLEVGDGDGIVINDLTITNGTFTVGTTSTYETETTDFTLFQNSPNPFTEETNIGFSLKNTSDTHLMIYNYTGEVIYEEIKRRGSGEHVINFKREIFPASGTYFYRLKTDISDSTRKLMILKN